MQDDVLYDWQIAVCVSWNQPPTAAGYQLACKLRAEQERRERMVPRDVGDKRPVSGMGGPSNGLSLGYRPPKPPHPLVTEAMVQKAMVAANVAGGENRWINSFMAREAIEAVVDDIVAKVK